MPLGQKLPFSRKIYLLLEFLSYEDMAYLLETSGRMIQKEGGVNFDFCGRA